jgi:plastocyanin
MRKLLYGATLAALAVALVPAATAVATKTLAVSITNSAFVPKNVSVSVGDTVMWTNKGTQNQRVACAKCPFTSPILKPGSTYSYTFNTAGKFAITDPLHTKIKGSVLVVAGPKSVTLTAAPMTVRFNHTTTLSGSISPARSGQNVVISAEACGETAFSRLVATTTGTGGTFSVSTTATLNTLYRAKSGTAISSPAPVHVRPVIRLKKVASHKYSVRVKAARAFDGKHVLFQKRTATGTWVKVKSVTLNTVSSVGSTTITKAKFRSKIRHGRKVRIRMKSSQAAPCYVGGHSNTIRS